MRLLYDHPEIASRSCDYCRRWQYDETTGKPVDAKAGPYVGTLTPRFAAPPCERGKCAKIGPDGERRDLTLRNLQAWLHYWECKAVGHFPDDPIVRRNARILAMIEHGQEQKTAATLEAFVFASAGGR